MKAMVVGGYYPGNSLLYRLSACVKIVCLLLLVAAVVCTHSAAGYTALLVASAAIVWISGLPLGALFGVFRRVWSFLLLVFLMNALFFDPTEAIWRFWIFSFSTAGLLQGVRVAANISLLLVLSNVLLGTTRPAEITGALTRLLWPLSYVGVPVQDVAMILTVAIRFIPTLLEESDQIRLAQTARGAEFDAKRLTDRAKNVLPLVVPLFLSAFKRADDLAQAMEARGYRGAKGRTAYPIGRLRRADYFAMLLCAGLCALQVCLLIK